MREQDSGDESNMSELNFNDELNLRELNPRDFLPLENRTDCGLVYNTEGTEGVPVDYLISNDIGFTIDVIASI